MATVITAAPIVFELGPLAFGKLRIGYEAVRALNTAHQSLRCHALRYPDRCFFLLIVR